jgi:hypothetical protein
MSGNNLQNRRIDEPYGKSNSVEAYRNIANIMQSMFPA